MPKITWLHAERNSPSDESLQILEVNFQNGSKVQYGQILMEVEGAKAVFEIASPSSGYFYHSLEGKESIKIGEILGCISEELLNDMPTYNADYSSNSVNRKELTNISQKALDYGLAENFDFRFLENEEFVTVDKIKRTIKFQILHEKPQEEFSKNEKVLLIGGGNGALLTNNIIQFSNSKTIIGVLDDKSNSLESLNIPHLGSADLSNFEKIKSNLEFDSIFICVSSSIKFRQKWLDIADSHDVQLSTVLHPAALIDSKAKLSQGLFAFDGARIGYDACIGANVFLSSMVNIEHHCVVGENTTFGPGVFLSGNVRVGSNCVFGTQISVEPNIKIGSNSVISSGSVITRDVPPNSIVKSRDFLTYKQI